MRNVHHHYARLLSSLALLALLAALIALAAPMPALTQEAAPTIERKASSTRVSASLHYTDGSKSKVPVWSDIKISIKRDDVVFTTDEPLPAVTASSFFLPPKLLATDLDDDHEPEVLVDVFTAGFDCCRRTVVYHRVGERFLPQVLDWDNTGYRLVDVGGGDSPEFVSSDGRFANLYRSDASGPIRIQRLTNDQVQDVTADLPAQLERDARRHKRAWTRVTGRRKGDARPAVAAYVVDLVRLGRVRGARKVIATAASRGDLRASSANAFARRIDQRMVAWGYLPKGKLGRVR